MCTSQHDNIYLTLDEWLNYSSHHLACGGLLLGIALHGLHKSSAYNLQHLYSLTITSQCREELLSLQTALGGDNGHNTRARHCTSRFDGRLKADDRYIEGSTQMCYGSCRSRITSDDDHLTPLANKLSHSILSQAAYMLCG